MSKELSNIKNILSDYEFEYDHNDWLKLEKELSTGTDKSFSKSKTFVISSLVVIIGLILYFIINSNNNQDGQNMNNTVIAIDDNANEEAENTTIIIAVNDELEILDIQEELVEENDSKEILEPKPEVEKTYSQQTQPKVEQPKASTSESTDDKNKTNSSSDNENPTLTDREIEAIKNIRLEIKISSNCTPARVEFSAQNVPKGYSIQWNTDDGKMLTGTNVHYTYNDGGSYWPEALIVSETSVLQSHKMKKLEIGKSNLAKINVEKNNDNVFLFTAETDPNAKVNYTWYILEKPYYSQKLQYKFDQAGNYRVYLTVRNNNGCINTVVETVEVKANFDLTIPDIFIPNQNDEINYFGPVESNIKLKEYDFKIYNSEGDVVFKSSSIENKWNGKIANDTTNVNAGSYIWEINSKDESGNTFNKKGSVEVSFE